MHNDIYDLVRTDEPINIGTALNKVNLLTNSIAELLGLTPADDLTVNDTLSAAARISDGFKYTTLVIDNADACNFFVPAGSTTANVQIQAAIDVLPSGGEKIIVLEDEYKISPVIAF